MAEIVFFGYKIIFSVSILLSYFLFYFLTNRYPIFVPKMMPAYSIDNKVPYVPWTVLLYVSFYLQLFLGLVLAPSWSVFHKMCLAYTTIIVFCSLVYLLFPTKFNCAVKDFDRKCLPAITKWTHKIVRSITKWTHKIVCYIKEVDRPNNCCPSSHVSLSLVIGVVYLACNSFELSVFFLVWGIFISASVLTVKQHCFVDLVVGIVVSLFFGFGSCYLF